MRAFELAILAAAFAGPFASELWAGHKLTPAQQRVLREWLDGHPQLRPATDGDCKCPESIKDMRRGYGGDWKGVPDYHPYVATGDFNSDGKQDFAAALVDASLAQKAFSLVVFNGVLHGTRNVPAFLETNLDLTNEGLFYGPPRPKPYRLLLGAFESHGGVLQPKGETYVWGEGEE